MKTSLTIQKSTMALRSMSLACLLGGGITQQLAAQDSTIFQRPLPNALQRGINVSHIWGSMQWWQSQRFAGQTNPRFPMIYDGPTTATIFDEDTSTNIKKKGFGHVRFFFDPLLVGFNFMGEYIYPSPTNITPGMTALLDDIREANEKGLAVVLNFFPYWISYEHNYRTVSGEPLNSEDWRNNPDSWKRKWTASDNPFGNPNLYPGPWRKDFAMHYGPVSGINQNHPLPRLWKGIAEILESEGIKSSNVFLQPMSEAQTGFADPNNFGTTPSIHPQYVTGSTAFQSRYERWRKIQLETIKAISLVNPDFNILVTSQESFPWSYLNNYVPPAGVANNLVGFTQFEPYSWIDGLNSTQNLIYTFHMYSPYDFTHNEGVTGDRERYVNKAADEAGGPITFPPTTRDDYQPSPPTTTSPHVRADSPYHYTGALAHFNLMTEWFNDNYEFGTQENDEETWAPPLMITEFGVWRKVASAHGGDPGTRDPLGRTNDFLAEGSPTYDDMFPLDIDRAKWVYDIRTLAKDHDFGWTYFDYSGGFRAFEGRMFKFNQTSLLRETPQPTALVPRFNQALFGATRP